jgi:hypothetical protein
MVLAAGGEEARWTKEATSIGTADDNDCPYQSGSYRTHTATEEAARTRLGFLRLTKGGQASTYADRVFA